MFRNKIGEKGFTLIELLVVIAIIGILSSVVLVSLQSSRAKARDAKRISDIDAIKTGLALYADANNSHYPDTLNGLVSPRYFSAVPKGPNGEDYSYVRSQDGLSYHLGATLEQTPPYQGVLLSDIDCNSMIPASCKGFSVVPTYVGATPFSGADPVYDVTP